MERGNDCEKAIDVALATVAERKSIRNVSKAFALPYSTLQDHLTASVKFSSVFNSVQRNSVFRNLSVLEGRQPARQL